ncbi:MAG: AAA family ATPase [Coriobacteriia bacterium]|nr:AAA family ATPase [Coriobacteriia bacterium]
MVDYFIKVVGAINERGEIPKDKNPYQQPDVPMGNHEGEPLPSVSFCLDLSALDQRVETVLNPTARHLYAESLSKLFRSAAYVTPDCGAVWIDFSFEAGGRAFGYEGYLRAIYSQYVSSGVAVNLQDASLRICNSASDDGSNYANIVRAMMPWDALPDFLKVEAIRSIDDTNAAGGEGVINSGHGLPAALLRLFNPEPDKFEQSSRRRAKLEGFVRDVLNDQGASILVSHDSHGIAVKTSDTGYLPLESLGTGLTELVILAAVVACNTGKIICLEEPEIHLHPALQARFMQYLLSDEFNRFIVTTHSPTVINAPGVRVAHVTKRGGVSTCRQLDGMVVARDLLDDLGARASDLLQSNYVIWVEGPSDRIYLNYWIKRWCDENDADLVEGINYSVMLYGGKLLNALDASANDGDEKLVALFRINTHFCVLMDSDRKTPGARIGKTKQRIVQQCRASDAISWVTWGSTIENYVPREILSAAIKSVHSGKHWKHELGDRNICPLSFTFEGAKSLKPNKIAVARAACEAGFESLGDCSKKVAKLCKAICDANGI